MTTITKTSTTTIDAEADAVWQELDKNFLEIAEWAGGVNSSTVNPATPTGVNGSPFGGRICDVDGVGETDERITSYDADSRTLTYTVRAKGMPFFVEGLQNTWTVTPNGPNQSTVDVKIIGTTKGIMGKIGAIPLGRMLGKAAVGLPNDLGTHLGQRSAS